MCIRDRAVVFGYSSSFVNYTVEVDGEPALFKLKKGENTITMQVVMGEMAAPIAEISEAISNLNVLYREIVQITGVSPDKFVDYDVCEKVDKLSDRMKSESNRLNGVIDYIRCV